ncbi:MAG: hypothetical protein KKE30_04610 [Gammaproteobacteria bacterium]|nr:hypothetical protein [Gammaproteobacteria bacterium]
MRSLPQNSYYWGVIVKIISDELGYSPAQIHEMLREEFLYEVLHIKTRDGITQKKIAKSTTEITTTEAEDYYSSIRQWASITLGLWIPEPHEETPIV